MDFETKLGELINSTNEPIDDIIEALDLYVILLEEKRERIVNSLPTPS